jgi:hypothetical protein
MLWRAFQKPTSARIVVWRPRNPFHPKRQVDVAGLVRQSSRRCVSQCRGRDTCKLVTFVKSKEKPVKQIAAFTLLVVLSVVSSMPVKAQSSGVKEYARQSQIAAKKQQKLQKKAAKKQRKAMKKYAKAQRKAAKKANHGGR